MSLPGAAGRDASVSAPDRDRNDLSFPRSHRLTQRKQFQAVYREGVRARSAACSFALFGLPNDVGHCRLGITVTRKVGCAATRNRIKRVLREAFRAVARDLEPGFDLVLHVYPGFETPGPSRLESELRRCFASLTGRDR